MKAEYGRLLETVRAKNPLVHHITNYVTVNDCANITLAIGASPVMADDIHEAADITRISSALVINMGTLNERTIASMLASGKAANAAGIPVVFDPVGVGASELRNQIAVRILDEVKVSVLRGNISETKQIAGMQSTTKGVDASQDDLTSADDAKAVAKKLSSDLGCVVAITGAVDTVSNGEAVVCIENGHPMLSGITGTGCMCSSLIGSFCGAASDSLFESAIAALLTMGVAGEIAFNNAGDKGNGSFHAALHDAVSCMDAEVLMGRAKTHETLY